MAPLLFLPNQTLFLSIFYIAVALEVIGKACKESFCVFVCVFPACSCVK